MIATLIILFSLFRDFRWPRKRYHNEVSAAASSANNLEGPSSATGTSVEEPLPQQVARGELSVCGQPTATTNSNNMQNGSDQGENGNGRRSGDEQEDDEMSGPRVVSNEKRPSEASSNSTSVSTEQTQIDATLGSTSSGTLPSISSPLTPSGGGGGGGSGPAGGPSMAHNQQQQHQMMLLAKHLSSHHLSSEVNQTMTTSSSATMNYSSTGSVSANTTSNTANNLRGSRHEHRLLSNSSTDTFSALNNLSSHSESASVYGGTNPTTGSGHSGVITYPFKIRGDSTASTISTSACSEVLLPPDGRRSSEGARLVGHRRSSGRIRRYIPRTTISSGGRRRTTGRYFLHFHVNV